MGNDSKPKVEIHNYSLEDVRYNDAAENLINKFVEFQINWFMAHYSATKTPDEIRNFTIDCLKDMAEKYLDKIREC
jgi:hypothetical protein